MVLGGARAAQGKGEWSDQRGAGKELTSGGHRMFSVAEFEQGPPR
jgi:hypothetical protein